MKKRIALLIVSLYLFISSLVILFCFGNDEDYFCYFTNLSNFFMGLSALILFLFLLLRRGQPLPRWLSLLQLAGTGAVSLTMITVLLFLMPQEWKDGNNGLWLLEKDMLFFHLLNPLAAAFSFAFLQKETLHTVKEALLGALPCVIYSVLYVTEVAILQNWEDFYGFTFGGQNGLIPLVLIVMYAASFGLSLLLVKLHNRHIAQ